MSQLWITDHNIFKSLNNLDRKRLHSMIYENIHGLGSMIGIVDKLILSDKAKIQAKKLKDKVQFKLWIGYEAFLFQYIFYAYILWFWNFANKKTTKYSETINHKNLQIIKPYIFKNYKYKKPEWITDEFIQTHRSVLIQKEAKKRDKSLALYVNALTLYEYKEISITERDKMIKKSLIKDEYHYRNLWPNCPKNLKMRYDWKENADDR